MISSCVASSPRLRAYLHAAPKGDVIFNLLSSLLRFRVIPGSILIHFFVDLNVIVAGKPFPGASALFFARAKIFLLDRLRREVMISLNDDRLVRFRQQRIFPSGFHKLTSLIVVIHFQSTMTLKNRERFLALLGMTTT